MLRIRKFIRSTILYAVSLMLVAGMPMTTFAQEVPPSEAPVVSNEPEPQPQPQPIPTPPVEESETIVAPPEQVISETPSVNEASLPEHESTPVDSTPVPEASTQTNLNQSSQASASNNNAIENSHHSTAISGDAQVSQNTNVGNATTGNADAQTTIINSVHSTIGGEEASSVAYFTTDIHGNVYGDITISPSINAATELMNANSKSVTNVESDTGITNTVTASATSGDATVDSNTTAGNATTGNANTVASIINLINTIIAANRSFVGTINIYGDLNGDILVSPEFIPQLLGTNQSASAVDTSLSANLESNQQIVNTIHLAATTGAATVESNTNAGNATTGNAATNLTVLNLTGREVTAANSLLVFVNVLGTWVGMIVDAPVGATSALIGNGVTHNSMAAQGVVNATDTAKITNNVDLSAASGDATVTRNTNAGNATTGNATASANIANIATSTFSISDWFGVLFINVFGTWQGSFGINTANGDIIPLGGDAVIEMSQQHQTSEVPFQFGFTPKPAPRTSALRTALPGLNSASSPVDIEGEDAATPTAQLAGAVLGEAIPSEDTTANYTLKPSELTRDTTANFIMMAVGFGITIVGALVAASRRLF